MINAIKWINNIYKINVNIYIDVHNETSFLIYDVVCWPWRVAIIFTCSDTKGHGKSKKKYDSFKWWNNKLNFL